MAGELAAIIAAYGLGVCLAHWMCRRTRSSDPSKPASCKVIVTSNVGMTIEWHLWTLAFAQWLQGEHAKVTILDEGSADETVRIAERMPAVLRAEWEVVRAASAREAQLWLEQASREGRADEVIFLRGTADSLQAAAGV